MKNGRVTRVQLDVRGDDRGCLVAIEADRSLFPIQRVYFIYDTAKGVVRGKHAHIELRQLLICTSGSCTIDTESGDGTRQAYVLDDPSQALLIEGLVWREMRDFERGAVLLVLADDHYDERDYVRDYSEFLRLAGRPS